MLAVDVRIFGRGGFPNPPYGFISSLAEPQPSFFEADVALLTDDNVVEHFDIQQLGRFKIV